MNPIGKTPHIPFRTSDTSSAAQAATSAPPTTPHVPLPGHNVAQPKAKGTANFQLSRRGAIRKTPEKRAKEVISKKISSLVVGDAIAVSACKKAMHDSWKEVWDIYLGKRKEELTAEQTTEVKNTLIGLYTQALAEQGFPNPFFMQRQNGRIFSKTGLQNDKEQKPPLIMKRGFIPHDLKIEVVAGKTKISEGANGYVSILTNPEGKPFIAKFDKHNRNKEMKDECAAYKEIYDKVGPHRNIVNVYGVTNIENKPALLMEMIPGYDGSETFKKLYDSWQAGHISSAQYWSAIQFIGRRLFEATKHLEKANILHNDIKPANFRFDLSTGEPKLIDLGRWCKTGKSRTGTPIYQSPEAEEEKPLDRRSDDYATGRTIMAGVEGKFGRNGKSAQFINGRWQWVSNEKAEKPTQLAYAAFLEKITSYDPKMRDGIENAAFLTDSMLDDDAAKEVIKNVLTYSTDWHKAGPARVEKLRAFLQKQKATLDDCLDLVRTAKVDPVIADQLASPILQQKIRNSVINELDAILLMQIRGSDEFQQSAKMFLLNVHRISKLQEELNMARADAALITARNGHTFPVSAYFGKLAQAIGTNLDGTPIETDWRMHGRTDARLEPAFSPPHPQTMNAARRLAADIFDQKLAGVFEDNFEAIFRQAENLIPSHVFHQWENFEGNLRKRLQSGEVPEGSLEHLNLETDFSDIREVLNVLRRKQRQEALKELFAQGAFPAARLRANIQRPQDS